MGFQTDAARTGGARIGSSMRACRASLKASRRSVAVVFGPLKFARAHRDGPAEMQLEKNALIDFSVSSRAGSQLGIIR